MSWFARLTDEEEQQTVSVEERGKWRLTDPVRLEQECVRLEEELEATRAAIEVAREEGRSESGAAVHELRETTQRIASLRGEVLLSVESELRDLAVAIAGRVLREELAREPERYSEMVQKIVIERAGDSALEIRCHPERHEQLRTALAGSSLELRLVSDQALGPWDFEVFTEHGHLDGRLNSQLDEVMRRLTAQPLDLVGVGGD